MKGKLIKDYNSYINYLNYKEGTIVEVTELETFKTQFAVYLLSGSLDWIPKNLIELI